MERAPVRPNEEDYTMTEPPLAYALAPAHAEALTSLGALVADYDDDREHYSRDDLVRLLMLLREVRAELAAVADEVTRDLLAHADTKRFVVPEIGEVAIRKSTKRTQWDHEALTRVVVARALDERLVDEDTGEYEAAHEAVARVLSECSRPSWRVTPLRARGIDDSEFCTVTENGWDVQLPPRG